MYNIVICDDERAVLESLEGKLPAILGGDCRIKSFDSIFAAESFVCDEAKGSTDILLMDISLPDGSGIELAQRLKARYPQLKVIFITGRIEYALDIFEAEPVYFLGKPISDEKLRSALNAACAAIEQDRSACLTLRTKGEVARVRYSGILYLESVGRTVLVHEAGGVRETYGKLSDLEPALPPCFLRCHQSFIVNMDRVKRLGAGGFLLAGDVEVPISHQKYRETKDRFLAYIGESV